MAGRDLKTDGILLHRHGGGGIDAVRGTAGFSQLRRQSQREAAGMRGGDQFLGIGAHTVLEPRAERILRIRECATSGGYCSLSALEISLPNRGCFALHCFSYL